MTGFVDRRKLEWYEIHDNVVILTRYMAEHHFTADEIADAVEKPHKYGEEFDLAIEELSQ